MIASEIVVHICVELFYCCFSCMKHKHSWLTISCSTHKIWTSGVAVVAQAPAMFLALWHSCSCVAMCCDCSHLWMWTIQPAKNCPRGTHEYAVCDSCYVMRILSILAITSLKLMIVLLSFHWQCQKWACSSWIWLSSEHKPWWVFEFTPWHVHIGNVVIYVSLSFMRMGHDVCVWLHP